MSTQAFSKARLERMHAVMAGYVERGEVPGGVTLVSWRGELHVDAIGTQAVGGSDPVRRDTIFRISSMTKPITAVATMILVEECKLRLDEPVDRLLPELAGRRVLKRLDAPLDDTLPAHRPITVRDLLTLRMGLGQLLAPSDAYPILQAASEQQISMGPPSPATAPAPDEWMCRLGLPFAPQDPSQDRRAAEALCIDRPHLHLRPGMVRLHRHYDGRELYLNAAWAAASAWRWRGRRRWRVTPSRRSTSQARCAWAARPSCSAIQAATFGPLQTPVPATAFIRFRQSRFSCVSNAVRSISRHVSPDTTTRMR